MSGIQRLIFLTCLAAAAASCSMVRTSKPENQKVGEGVSYYLPQRLFKIVFERNFIDADLKEAMKDAKAALDAASGATKAAGAVKKQEQAILDQLPAASPARADQQKRVELAMAAVGIAEAAETKAKVAYANAYQAFRANEDLGLPECRFVDKISIQPLDYSPDPQMRFVANLDHHLFRSDSLKLSTSAGGLLSTASGTSEDKTAEALVALARGYAARGVQANALVAKFDFARNTPQLAGRDCAKLYPVRFEDIVDPLDLVNGSASFRRLKSFFESIGLVNDANGQYCVEVSPKISPVSSVQYPTNFSRPRERNKGRGLYYRRNQTQTLRVMAGSRACDSTAPVVAAFQLEFPQGAPIELLPFPAGAFVTTEYAVEFSNGMLLSQNAKRPSEALGLASIPYDFIKALIQIPAELIKLRVDYSTQDVALVHQQRLLLCELERLRAAQESREADASLCADL